MLRMTGKRTQEQWAETFAHAKHGHILWDGNATNPTDPVLAYITAHDFISYAKSNGMFSKKNSKILDLGCGNGRFGIVFSEMAVEYEGIDPMKECIDFCKYAFSDFDHIKFHHTPVHHPEYGLKGNVPKEQFTLKYPDNTFDDVIVYSVFTHLQTLETAQNYMREIKRVMKPGSNLFVTWYRSPPDPVADSTVGRTVYREADIINLMSGLELTSTYGGHSGHFYDQWSIFAKLMEQQC